MYIMPIINIPLIKSIGLFQESEAMMDVVLYLSCSLFRSHADIILF